MKGKKHSKWVNPGLVSAVALMLVLAYQAGCWRTRSQANYPVQAVDDEFQACSEDLTHVDSMFPHNDVQQVRHPDQKTQLK